MMTNPLIDPVQTRYRLLTVSVVSIMLAMASQTALAAEELDDEPAVTLDTITVIAPDLSNSENSDDYTFYRASSATGLTLTPKETPQSVTTITAQQIEDQDLETVTDVIRSTPGISSGSIDGGRFDASARGFDITQYRVDGQDLDFVSQWSIGETLNSTAIYDRVEVVRGAAGLTTGSGRPSASINLIRKRANSRVPTTTLSADVNQYGTYGATVDTSTPLTKDGNVRGRFVAQYQEGDTYLDREDRKLSVLYGVVDADITDATTVSFGVSQQDNELNESPWGPLPAYYTDGSKADWDISKNPSVDWSQWNSTNRNYFGTITHDLNDDWRLELKANRSENDADDKRFFLFGNTVDKETGLGAVAFNGRYEIERDQDNLQATIDGNFEAFGQRHEVQLGASYNKNKLEGYSYTATPNFDALPGFNDWDGSYAEPVWTNLNLDTDLTTTEKSIFASSRFQLTDPLAVILGSRVTDYENQGVNFGTDVDITHDSVWVPYVGATYDVNDTHTLFASYTSIFEPQAERNIRNELLDPIDGNNYELGIKSSNDDGTLQTQFSVFRIKQDNLAQRDGENQIPGIGTIQQAFVPADGAKSTGIDVELTGRFTPKWQTSIGYTQFTADDRDGKTVNSDYPDRLFKLFTTYDMSNWVDGLTIGGGVNWADERYTLLTNPASKLQEKYTQDAVTLVDLMARYDVNDDLALQLNVDNLFDEKYVDGINFSQIYYGKPLTVSGKLTYKF